ncbi:MAG TPA: DeoR/GlpR family DNA-binding transcription regulator [Ilumatobacteraceae bacterium]
MFAEERHQEILRRARAAGRVDVASLAEEFAMTPETIRRDLTVLERAGHVRRVHGGAIPLERFGIEPTMSARAEAFTSEKQRIAKAALAELPEAGAVLLDAGTTTRELAAIIPADRELLVVVNSPEIALLLADRSNLTVWMLGGRVRQRTLAVVDEWATRLLDNVRVDVAFMATNGVSIERGLTTPDPAEAQVKRSMIAAARRVVLLADHSKIGTDYFASFGSVADLDVLVTDSNVEMELIDELSDAGPRVVLT